MDLNKLRSLVAVLEHGSFSAAAEGTGIPRSTLRDHVEALEKDLDTQLLVRNSQGVTSTRSGGLLQRGGKELLTRAAALEGEVRSGTDMGIHLAIRIPSGVPRPMELAGIAAWLRSRPEVRTQVEVSSAPIIVVPPDLDVVFTNSTRPPPRGPYRTFVIYRTPERLVASPDYLAEYGRPLGPEDLRDHRLLTWWPPGEDPAIWVDIHGSAFRVSPSLVHQDLGLLEASAEAGHGIVRIPRAPVPGSRLEEVLNDQFGRLVTARAILREESADTPRARFLVELARWMKERWTSE